MEEFKKAIEQALSANQAIGRARPAYTVQLLCVSLCLLVFVLFEPYGAFHAHLLWVTLLLALSVAPVTIFPNQLGFAATKERHILRILLAVGSLTFLYFALAGSLRYLGTIFREKSSYWVFITALTFYITGPVRRKMSYWYPGQKEGAQLARWAIIITLTILSVLSFAYRVYPLIPADKGGGNFRFSRDARVCMMPDGSVPQALRDVPGSSCSVDVKILEITDTTVYSTRADDPGINDLGQRPNGDNREPAEIWSEGHYFPTVFAISRNRIAFIQYELPRRHFSSLSTVPPPLGCSGKMD